MRGRGRVRILVAATLLASTALAAAPAEGKAQLKLNRVGQFSEPLYVAFAPGKANRKLAFVVEQAGVVRVVRAGTPRTRPFLDIRERVLTDGGEEGLLSIVFDPDYRDNRRLFAYFTNRRGSIQVSSFRRTRESRLRARPASARKVIEVPHPGASNHNGGTLAFGPDRRLWLATGDGGGGCDPARNAQDRTSLLGKLLRIAPRRKRGYSVPRGNPFVDRPGRDEIWALGLRNPFRFSFEGKAGELVIADVGQSAREEINHATRAAARGANFGWNAFEGTLNAGCGTDGSLPADRHTPPVHEYSHSGGGFSGCSITGGTTIRDPRLGALRGLYLYSDFCNGSLRGIRLTATGAKGDRALGSSLSLPTSFTTGPGRRVWATSLAGGVYRLGPG